MSEGRTPSPNFDESRYERPNKNWLCGHACDGCPCRIGPSPSGECRATTECKPQLVTAPGETKGTWKCTRPKDWGGTCPDGPLPDGTCCKAVTKCRPVRSLRARRGLITRAFVIVCVALLLIGLGGTLRESFINPAPLSPAHSGPEFARLAAKHANISVSDAGQGCVACHPGINGNFTALASEATGVARNGLAASRFITPHPKDFSRMDASCVTCHSGHTFHQASVAKDMSCSVCHLEHKGPGTLAAVSAQNCVTCHGDADQMRLASEKAATLSTAMLSKTIAPGLITPAVSRPAAGFTQLIQGFATNHPEFQVVREKNADRNTLKFNHALHLTGSAIPTLGGKSLECASCHQPDASGAFMQRVSFEKNCRSCHSLSIDETTPGLELPHGNPDFARAFLRSLPTQYADHAKRRLGMTGQRDIEAFVKARITGLRERTLSGENLERAVFFADGAKGEATIIAGREGLARARFAGCAYCHEVTPQGNATPLVTTPQAPDRWMPHASFNHAKHTTMACVDCHTSATSSQLTADVIMPTQQSCVACHSPKGGAGDSCMTCHNYHNTAPAGLTAALRTAILQ
ncbi:cytochrome c3 family protein [Rariglobus hedericola]|uniref:Cytochrome c7-like domain-containing protein n=1 Tax=Rariglobus hedericola TaxID=2597822 RepID=A0A556QL45_9BACT|nr:cytochrome c3 family protein [Rariglobus hedericola]TSJ77364.1 hypothetical protein FPL22_14830 [Rariglobus hedericola]